MHLFSHPKKTLVFLHEKNVHDSCFREKLSQTFGTFNSDAWTSWYKLEDLEAMQSLEDAALAPSKALPELAWSMQRPRLYSAVPTLPW